MFLVPQVLVNFEKLVPPRNFILIYSFIFRNAWI